VFAAFPVFFGRGVGPSVADCFVSLCFRCRPHGSPFGPTGRHGGLHRPLRLALVGVCFGARHSRRFRVCMDWVCDGEVFFSLFLRASRLEVGRWPLVLPLSGFFEVFATPLLPPSATRILCVWSRVSFVGWTICPFVCPGPSLGCLFSFLCFSHVPLVVLVAWHVCWRGCCSGGIGGAEWAIRRRRV